MPYSFAQYVGNGVTDIFNVPFPFISIDHVSVTLDGVPSTFDWQTTATVKLPTKPATGVIVKVLRVTPTNTQVVTYKNGVPISMDDLNSSATQNLYAMQEFLDNASDKIEESFDGKWDAKNKSIKNLADPVDPQDAVSKVWAETGMTSQLQAASAVLTQCEAEAYASQVSKLGADAAEAGAVVAQAQAEGFAEQAAASAVAAGATVAASVPDASSTVKGKVQLGTDADALAGVNTTKAATPANVKAVGDTKLAKDSNLGDVPNPGAARVALGLEIGVNVLSPTGDGSHLTGLASIDQVVRNNVIRNALKLGVLSADSSGPIPSGYLQLFPADELLTRTNADYSVAAKRYSPSALSYSANIASNSYALSNSNYYPTAGAFDGADSEDNSAATWWAPSQQGVAVIGVAYLGQNFGTARNVGKVRVYQPGTFFCTSIKVQYSSDGITWADAGTFTGVAGANVFTFSAISAQYWRIMANSATTNGSYWCLAELSFYTVTSVGNMVLMPSAVACGTPPKAVDLFIVHKAVDVVALANDIKVRITLDGSAWSGYSILEDLGVFDSAYKLLHVRCDTSSLSGSTGIKWELSTYNSKNQYLRAAAMLFSL